MDVAAVYAAQKLIPRQRGKIGGMTGTWIESVYSSGPPRTLYYEKCEGTTFSSCRIEIEPDVAHSWIANVRFDDDPHYKCFPFGEDSERMAVEYVSRLGYAPAEDWTLPKDPRTSGPPG